MESHFPACISPGILEKVSAACVQLWVQSRRDGGGALTARRGAEDGTQRGTNRAPLRSPAVSMTYHMGEVLPLLVICTDSNRIVKGQVHTF